MRDRRHDVTMARGVAMVVDKQVMIYLRGRLPECLYIGLAGSLLAYAKIENRSRGPGSFRYGSSVLVEMGNFQRAGEEAHGRSTWVISEAISTLGSRVTAGPATRAKMHDGTSAEPQPQPQPQTLL